jgi:hypothetical protein
MSREFATILLCVRGEGEEEEWILTPAYFEIFICVTRVRYMFTL